MSNPKVIIGFLIVAIIGGFLLYFMNPTPEEYVPEGEQTICTADAMQCPDGSYVGRTGPNCEFVCPGNIPAGAMMEDGTIN